MPSADPARDARFMRLALALGARNLGATWPNPSVGAVVVDTAGRIVGVGVTQPGGRPHAERVALEAAGAAARDATLYVTLEPCSARSREDYGSSCTDLIVAAGIRRLVIGAPDPSPFAHGEGFPRLAAAGVTVETGLLAEEAARAHRGHCLRITEGRPAVTLKLARTADGYAAAAAGSRLLITGEIANARVHLMRAHADAVMVGSGTVLADDPLLTVRLTGLEERSPVRVVLDGALRLPPAARLVQTARETPTWVVTTLAAPVEAERRMVAAGVEVMRVEGDAMGRVRADEALRLLAARGITRVFSEGGPRLAEALAAADLVDELVVLTGPRALAAPGVPALGPAVEALRGRMRPLGEERAGADRIETFERPV